MGGMYDGERWATVPEHPKYEVSTFGRVRSLLGTLISQNIRSHGYCAVVLRSEGTRKTKEHLVHRLVASAFLERTPERTTVAHFDGNRLNNHVDNLRWATPFENKQDDFRNGKVSQGENHPCSKFSNDDVRMIRADVRKNVEIARQYGVNPSSISEIRSRKTYAHVA